LNVANAGSVPHSNQALVVNPFGFAMPLRVALSVVIDEAAAVVTTGVWGAEPPPPPPPPPQAARKKAVIKDRTKKPVIRRSCIASSSNGLEFENNPYQHEMRNRVSSPGKIPPFPKQ
jgi:hypothetical protein